jgi:hypothetical protein
MWYAIGVKAVDFGFGKTEVSGKEDPQSPWKR